MTTAPILTVNQVSKEFTSKSGKLSVLQSLSFEVEPGEFICLLGPSGSGKSTLLRIVGALLKPDRGEVYFDGERLSEPRTDIGFVFQAQNLMPWRTVLQNVLLPVQVQTNRMTESDETKARELRAAQQG